jgi:hypothetical protein
MILSIPYRFNILKNLCDSNSEDNLSIIISTLTHNIESLIQQFFDIYLKLSSAKVKVSITELVRSCKTSYQLFKSDRIQLKYIGGISALPIIVDSLSDADCYRITKDFLELYILYHLSCIIIIYTKEIHQFWTIQEQFHQ